MKNLFLFLLVSILITSCGESTPTFEHELVSAEAIGKAQEAETDHPSGFYTSVGVYMDKEAYEDAGFLFYLGQLRYRYFLACYPDHDDERAIFATLHNLHSAKLDSVLMEDQSKYAELLDAVIQYSEHQDYFFCPKSKNKQAYQETVGSLIQFREELKEDSYMESAE